LLLPLHLYVGIPVVDATAARKDAIPTTRLPEAAARNHNDGFHLAIGPRRGADFNFSRKTGKPPAFLEGSMDNTTLTNIRKARTTFANTVAAATQYISGAPVRPTSVNELPPSDADDVLTNLEGNVFVTQEQYSTIVANSQFTGTSNSPLAPPAPFGLSAVASGTSVSVSFTQGSDNGSEVTNYQYSVNGGDGTSDSCDCSSDAEGRQDRLRRCFRRQQQQQQPQEEPLRHPQERLPQRWRLSDRPPVPWEHKNGTSLR
jgi:hypothetical protein